MIKFIDDYLNITTQYRLVLYVLIALLLIALGISFFNLLPFTPLQLILSTICLIFFCWVFNKIFAQVFKASTNTESVYITAFILTLIVTPISNLSGVWFLLMVALLSQGSKYILAINKKHIFNPAALGVFLTSLVLKSGGASWWVGNSYMLIPVLIGGLLVVKKVRRFSLLLSFLTLYVIFAGPSIVITIFDSPIFFFAFIMLTEPQTTPPTKRLQMFYGGLVGLMTFYQTPEVALLIGNIFSYAVSPKQKLFLKLTEKNKLAPDTYDFIFRLDKPFNYHPGQYMEWTLGHNNPDLRGNRRYFTLASSPTENNLRIGIKFYDNASSFKRSLVNFQKGDQIVAAQLSGEFTLPKDRTKKICFIAGGIGITPFRSMIKYLIDTDQTRDIILLYSVKAEEEIVYDDIFEKGKEVGVETYYIVTNKVGLLDEKKIREKVADYKNRIFYISGSHSMVDAFEKILNNMKVINIKIDFFPGYV